MQMEITVRECAFCHNLTKPPASAPPDCFLTTAPTPVKVSIRMQALGHFNIIANCNSICGIITEPAKPILIYGGTKGTIRMRNGSYAGVISNGQSRAVSYDPHSGEIFWSGGSICWRQMDGMGDSCITSFDRSLPAQTLTLSQNEWTFGRMSNAFVQGKKIFHHNNTYVISRCHTFSSVTIATNNVKFK